MTNIYSIEVLNPHRSIGEFFATFQMPIPRDGDWRLADYSLGQINGLPNSIGRVVCTNGIMCYIQREDGTLYHGHFTAWVKEPTVKQGRDVEPQTRKAIKIPVCFEGF